MCPGHSATHTTEMDIWLEKHHRVVPPSDLNADEVHIFASKAVGIFGDNEPDKIYYEITFKLGPIDFKNWVGFGRDGKKFFVYTSFEIPLNPAYKLGYASGNMDERITMKFEKFPKGSFDFYIKDKWMWLQYDVTSFGRQYVGDIKLVPPPS